MEEIVHQALAIARSMWKFRWPALLVTWVVALIGTVVVFKIPDQYEASARIYVDTQSILKPLMSGLTVQPNVEQQISMLSRMLISRPNIEKLIRMADLDLKADSKGEQEKLVETLTKDIQIRNTGRDNLYSLVIRGADQEKAKRVIQSLVSIFVESGLGASRKDTDSAKTFLNDQIKQYETKLEEAEARVKEFRLRNLDRQSPDGKDSAQRLAEINAQYQQALLELREAENARDGEHWLDKIDQGVFEYCQSVAQRHAEDEYRQDGGEQNSGAGGRNHIEAIDRCIGRILGHHGRRPYDELVQA